LSGNEDSKLAKKMWAKRNCICKQRFALYAIVSFCLFITGGLHTTACAEDEIAVIKFTDVEGHIELRYREDEQTIGQSGSSSTEKRATAEEEIFLLTHGYIYHPKFLNMDLGFGPLFTQSDLESSFGSASDDSSEYNFLARLRFLEEKPYPLTLFYERDHPSVSLTLTDRFQQKSEKYGFNFQLKEPVLPFTLSIGASQHQTEGEGFDIRIDDTTEQKFVRADIPMGKDGYGQLVYNLTDITSRSGFRSEPITSSQIKTEATSFDSRVFLGENNQFNFRNYLSYVEQSNVRPYKEFRYTPELRWTHSEDLESFYRLGYLNSEQITVETTNYNASTGFRLKLSDNTNLNADFHGEDNTTTGLNSNSYGVAGTLNHKKKFSFGTLSLSGGWNYDEFDRQTTMTVPVDFQVNFIGTTAQFLPHDNIILSTIRVARIFNGTEIPLTVGIETGCIASIDILVRTIGTRTQVENCNGATDGDITTRMEYNYDPGGTVAYSRYVQSYQANLNLYQYSNLYVHWRESKSDVNSGTPTFPLDESTNTQVGANFDYPFNETVTLGGEAVYEDENGTQVSYLRKAVDSYMLVRFFSGTVRFGDRRVVIDYANTTEDVELIRQSIQFNFRPWNLFSFTAELSDEEDTGGSITRRTKIRAINADWRLRKLIMRGELRMIEEKYGTNNRDRSLIRVSVRRNF